MTDRKEVLDYLRNQQKAAEIEAKMNGVNVWVLAGAIAVVGWQLTSVSTTPLWNDNESIARIFVSAVAFFVLSTFIGRSSSDRDELRYSPNMGAEIESHFLLLLMGLLILLPPAMLWLMAGMSAGVFILSFIGSVYIILASVSILKPLLPESESSEKFPKPEFTLPKNVNAAIELFLNVLILVAFAEQIKYFLGVKGGVSIDDVKPTMLLAVFYLLILITVSRQRRNERIAWTYDLETDMVLGVISPEVAIRRIENRRLGPRLQDVVDRFFDELDRRFNEVESKLTECPEKINAAKGVPDEYPAERASRIKDATDDLVSQIKALAADCNEFREYLAKIEKKLKRGRMAVVGPVLASLKVRHEAYEKRAQTAKVQLERLLT